MYNLILSKHIREWERTLILEAKNHIESQGNLEEALTIRGSIAPTSSSL